MAVELVEKRGNGIFPDFFGKVSQILNKEIFRMNRLAIDWEKLKVDLEGLSKSQLDLVLRLIEQMKTLNKADLKEAESSRN